MTKNILTLALTLLLVACGTAPIPDNGVKLRIDGMTCEPCAETLMKKFSKEDALVSSSVDWETGEAILIQKDGQRIKDVQIEKIVDWSGFELVSISR